MIEHLCRLLFTYFSNCFWQIDLGNARTITGVATQGDPSSDKWVETYTVSYSYTGHHWTQYKGHLPQPEVRFVLHLS